VTAASRFEYTGDPGLESAILAALHRVIDPEMSLDIVELGLVYAVDAKPGFVAVRVTMTSAACPVAEFIVDEIVVELKRALGDDVAVDVDLVWEPSWAPERMSDRAREIMGWD
jgi:metal-sulfur cluster biosynthetic enzyme